MATMVPMKMTASQRYSLKSQTNRTSISNCRQNAVSYSWSYYAIFAWFDDSIAMYALGNKLYVIRTCPSLFLQALLLKSLCLYAFVCWSVVFVCVCVFSHCFSSACAGFRMRSNELVSAMKSTTNGVKRNNIEQWIDTKNVNVITFSFTSILRTRDTVHSSIFFCLSNTHIHNQWCALNFLERRETV